MTSGQIRATIDRFHLAGHLDELSEWLAGEGGRKFMARYEFPESDQVLDLLPDRWSDYCFRLGQAAAGSANMASAAKLVREHGIKEVPSD